MWLLDIFKVSPLKRKVLRIKKYMKLAISAACEEKFFINWYGAYDNDPKYLVFLVCVKTDYMKEKLKNDNVLNEVLRKLLEKYDYPFEARNYVIIDFESQETVNRESAGNWHVHLQ